MFDADYKVFADNWYKEVAPRLAKEAYQRQIARNIAERRGPRVSLRLAPIDHSLNHSSNHSLNNGTLTAIVIVNK